MLHTAVGRDDALFDLVAPHLPGHKLPQKMRVHNRKLWFKYEQKLQPKRGTPNLRP